MNRLYARHLENIDMKALRAYFGRGYKGFSPYRMKMNFTPECIFTQETAPLQLHKLERTGGVFTHTSRGGPDLRPDFVAHLDGIPYQVMVDAMDYVKQNDWDAWRCVNTFATKGPYQTTDDIASRLNLSRSGCLHQFRRGIEGIACYLHMQTMENGDEANESR